MAESQLGCFNWSHISEDLIWAVSCISQFFSTWLTWASSQHGGLRVFGFCSLSLASCQREAGRPFKEWAQKQQIIISSAWEIG